MPPMSSSKQSLKHARAAIDRKDFDAAIAYCREVLRSDPSNYNAFVFIGLATASKKDFERSEQAYNRAISLRPENPLAYKGLIETYSKPDAPRRPLALAEAHITLASHSTQFASQSLSKATEVLNSLPLDDAQNSKPLATRLIAVLDSHAQVLDASVRDSIILKLARLLALDLPQRADPDRATALDIPPLSDVLTRVATLLTTIPSPPVSTLLHELVIERAAAHISQSREVHSNISFLRSQRAYEELLQLAELDHVAPLIPPADRELLAARAVHLHPFEKRSTTSKAVLAAALFTRGCAIPARNLAGADEELSSKIPPSGKEVAPGCTQAIVKAFLHFKAEDFRFSVFASGAGRRFAARNSPSRARMHNVLGLIHAAGLCETRKFKEASRVFEIVRDFGRDNADNWIEAAAHRGLVHNAVTGHGRRSRQASTAVEEAAASASNLFGLLECVWADALVGDLDVERMYELVSMALEKARATPKDENGGIWEYALLDSAFTWADAEVAAVASVRLGQMLIKQNRSSVDVLREAQTHHMEAASLVKNMPDPLAHLGYIFELLADLQNEEKMRTRAVRCFEKAVAVDAAHPLAARRLARLQLLMGKKKEAGNVALRASARNPKSRWAHNFLGWHYFSSGKMSEAATAFQAGVKGKPKLTSREEEILFGTVIGQCEADNDLVMDIDSWRGLGLTYACQGKTGPALACLEDAQKLLEKPPGWYTSVADLDLPSIQKSLSFLLETEKFMLLFMGRQTVQAEESISSLLNDVRTPATILYHHAEVMMQRAAIDWLHGCYKRSVKTRARAAHLLENCIEKLMEQQPELNLAALYKRVGDMWVEAVTESPEHLQPLISGEFIDSALSKAHDAYLRAEDAAIEGKVLHRQDIAAATLRKALYTKDGSLARDAISSLLETDAGPFFQCLGLLSLARLSSSVAAKDTIQIAERLAQSPELKKNQQTILSTSIAMLAPRVDDLQKCSKAAISAVRYEPTDWRCWLAIATVRETDAERHSWARHMVRSCEDALGEADRLGGGPVVVQGRVRCLTRELTAQRQSMSAREMYADATFCSALSGRAGLDEPGICREIIDEFIQMSNEDAMNTAKQLQVADPYKLYQHVHMFPYLPEIPSLVTSNA